MGTTNLDRTSSEERHLSKLLNYIESGSADVEDFKEFEKILLDNGIDRDDIFKPLQREHIKDWDDLVNKRKNVAKDDYKKKNLYEALVIGVLLGLGLYVLYKALSKK
tara:strand:+ start:944 stop:1264 length:321 start_codon:yes stop_codon:yes gene_type:complete